MGATDEVHLRTETRVLLKKETQEITSIHDIFKADHHICARHVRCSNAMTKQQES